MKRLLLLFAFFSFALPSFAQDTLEGIWMGGISINGSTLRIAFHISKAPAGLQATMDSIDQGARGIPVTSVSRNAENVVIRMDNIGGEFNGKLDQTGNTIDGVWKQAGSELPLVLKRTDAAALEQKRPQNPTKPYPYREEEVTFENKAAGAIRLAGTLTLPQGKGPFTAVVLITGSGPQNRDEELFGHRPFLVLSDYLTRKGIAVLRVDDRGIGQSQGKFADATTADFATDVEAAVAFLKTRNDINAKKIGLIGHSEGGTIAPMVASRNPDVAFVVMMAGSGVPGDQIIPAQAKALAKLSGAPEDKAEDEAKLERSTIALVENEKDPEVLKKKLHDLLASTLPAERINGEIAILTSPWYRYFLTYDPAPALRKLTCPVLALNGTLDFQIDPKLNLPAIRQALAANKNAQIVELPGLNHLFQTAKTGSISEYGQIEETISPVALQTIADFVVKQ